MFELVLGVCCVLMWSANSGRWEAGIRHRDARRGVHNVWWRAMKVMPILSIVMIGTIDKYPEVFLFSLLFQAFGLQDLLNRCCAA